MSFVDSAFEAFFDLVPTGAVLYAPVLGAGGDVVDFRFVRLNAAGQRLLGLPGLPTQTFRELYPTSVPTGIFARYCDAYLTGQVTTCDVPYEGDGFDTFFRLVAQRSGELLVVNFTDMADLPRSAVEESLRTSQAREQAARAAAERQRGELERVLEQAPAAIAVYRGPAYTIELANPTVARLWGRTREQLLGKGLFEALPEVAGLGYEQLLDGVMATGVPHVAHAMEAQHDRNGQRETVYWDFVYVPMHAADGAIDGVMVVATEVTEQVRARQRAEQLNLELEARVQERTQQLEAAQAAAERQRRQWHELFMQAPASICIFDGPEWVYEFVNPGYQAMFPGRALLGKRLVDALPEVADQPLMDILHRVYDTGEPFEGKDVLVPLARTEEGPVEDIYFDLTYQARRNEDGQIDGFVTYAYDVTEQVRARREREARQGQLHRLFEQAPAAIFVLRSPAYIFEVVNPSMGEMLGMPPDQMLGKGYFDLLPGLAAQGNRQLLDHVWHSGQQYAAQEQAAKLPRHGEGEIGYYNFVYVPLREASGDVGGIMCVAVDVTPQVQARQQVQLLNEELAAINEELTATNEELNESNNQLMRTNADLDNFIYTASHDLKQPIANIEGLLHGVLHELPPAGLVGEVPIMLGLMQKAIERFGRTILHLTDISRLQQEHDQPAVQVSLAPVVHEVQLDLAPLIAQTQAQVSVSVPADVTLRFSEKNLRSVVYNLFSNALKYRHPDRAPAVSVTYEQRPAHHMLEVRDNGLGLDVAQDEEKVFGLFKRLHPHVEGSGVGLYMVRKMVENAGGRIAVESALNQGSVFRVYFPR